MRATSLLPAVSIVSLLSLVLVGTAPAQGTRIGFEEEFALSDDRAAALEQLIPGTVDYYYYHCLHYQNNGALDRVLPLLQVWIERHGRNSRVLEIENRQALLSFGQQPAATYNFLTSRLGLRFDHQRQISGEKPNLPTRLDPVLLSPAILTRRALKNHPGSLDGFRDSALEAVAGSELGDDLLMSLLKRLARPDLPNLPALVVRNLDDKHSRGFGSLTIHKRLLRDQLEACSFLRPDLLKDSAFIDAYLRRLRPSDDLEWRQNVTERETYLARLQAFTDRLAPAHNSLKGHVLYHRLVHDLGQGKLDQQRFLSYLRLPRKASYVNPDYLKRQTRSSSLVNTGQIYPTDLAPIGNDEPLVRAYLSHFFTEADSFEPYAEMIRKEYLSRLFAETKILAGSGDMERWYSLLNDPTYYESLKERVEIEFPPTQRTDYAADEPVSIEVLLKNVDTLLVKVFEINSLNYLSEAGKEVDASINVDGLVANEERTFTYEDNSLRRVSRKFDFPDLRGPGVYVLEFIGNGLSSRAVIRKGRLQFVERIGAAGHVLRVLDEEGTHLRDTAVRLGGHEYKANEDGEILIPFSTKPGTQSVILRHGGLSTLARFEHLGEEYRLEAGIFVDRESLLAGKSAKIIVRPRLLVNGIAASLDLLMEPTLSLVAMDQDGLPSVTEVRDIELSEGREFIHQIQVPEKLSRLSISFRGRVRNLSRGEDLNLDSGKTDFRINAIDGTAQITSPLLGRTAEGYVLDVLGKNGEPIADHAVELRMVHRDYTEQVVQTLKTDERGRITLGALVGIEILYASGLPSEFGGWELHKATRTYPRLIQGVAGRTIRVPYQGKATSLNRSVASLLEIRDGAFISDAFESMALVDGYVELRDLPPGNYSLLLKEAFRSVAVKVTAGKADGGWALGRDRMLEIGGSAPLHIVETRVEGNELLVRLGAAGAEARVHLFSTRYLAAFDSFRNLVASSAPLPESLPVLHADSSYHSGREIGDEYRYILERRYATKFPGNMLRRPGLLLNPWALDVTDSSIGVGGGVSGKWGGREGAKKSMKAGGRATRSASPGAPGTFPSLEFLAAPSRALVNLEPDANGIVRVPLSDLGDGQLVHAVALDGESTVYHSIALPEKELQPRDQRLANALDSDGHFLESKRIDFVSTDATSVIEDIVTSDVKSYDSLASVYQLFQTLSGNQDLVQFSFILDWPELSDEEKRQQYSRHACHELHFFLYHKDPEFFAAVIRPYLANKAHRTFLDRWLLDEDLSGYLDPWAFGRLNVVERILLTHRLEGRKDAVARYVRELLELQPSNPERAEYLFKSALKSGALDQDMGVNFRMAQTRDKLAVTGATAGFFAADDPAAPAGEPAPSEEYSKRLEEFEEEVEEQADADEAPARASLERRRKSKDSKLREQARKLYRAPSKTRQYVEHNYWHLRIQQQNADLIGINPFWRDYADQRGLKPFFSTHFPAAAGSFAEMMLALSVLDLPFTAGEHKIDVEGHRLSLTTASPMLLVKKEIKKATEAGERIPILLSQNFFRLDDQYRYEGNERRDRFVTDEFLAGVAYGCQVVLTNPSSSPRKLELLLQIPKGAIPVQNGFETRGMPAQIGPYGTVNLEYAFYFPVAGSYPHYPAHAGQNGELVAFAEPVQLKVVMVPSKTDSTSWEHISQSGTPEQVLEYLNASNIHRIDLSRIAWRMRDRAFFDSVISLLRDRLAYNDVLWSYGLRHAVEPVAREYLRHADQFLANCGRYLDTALVSIDPIERHAYQHIEYAPLFNGRAHRFGKHREILNHDLARQYGALLDILAYRPQLDDTDWMSVTYYLLLQDRVEDAQNSFALVNPARLPMALQYDYMHAYMDFFTEDHRVARGIAAPYRDHPVERWRALFQDVLNQLDEAEGKPVATSNPEDRTQTQTELAASEPALDLKVESQSVTLAYQNLERCDVSYYQMDIEFLFSTNPFVQQGSGSFAYIRPNRIDSIDLSADRSEITFALPEEFQSSNVLVEVRGGGISRRQAYYANSIAVQMIENYGQLKVTHAKTGGPLSKVYVKVFARLGNGTVRFHKDGYTDLRGRFDYASLSGDGSEGAERYSILVLSEKDGAIIREVAPPLE